MNAVNNVVLQAAIKEAKQLDFEMDFDEADEYYDTTKVPPSSALYSAAATNSNSFQYGIKLINHPMNYTELQLDKELMWVGEGILQMTNNHILHFALNTFPQPADRDQPDARNLRHLCAQLCPSLLCGLPHRGKGVQGDSHGKRTSSTFGDIWIRWNISTLWAGSILPPTGLPQFCGTLLSILSLPPFASSSFLCLTHKRTCQKRTLDPWSFSSSSMGRNYRVFQKEWQK